MATMYKSRRGDWSLSSISRGSKVRASPWLRAWRKGLSHGNPIRRKYYIIYYRQLTSLRKYSLRAMIGHQKFSWGEVKKNQLKFNQIKDCFHSLQLYLKHMSSSVTEEHTVRIICKLCKKIRLSRIKQTSLLCLLAYLDIKDSKTRWMDIIEHRETLVSDQIPVGNLWWCKWQKHT